MQAVRRFTDITNVRRDDTPIVKPQVATTPEVASPTRGKIFISPNKWVHSPYNWKALPEEPSPPAAAPAAASAPSPAAPAAAPTQFLLPDEFEVDSSDCTPEGPSGDILCVVVVRHKCRISECRSTLLVQPGQYLVIQGDRGIDIGVVSRTTVLRGDEELSELPRTAVLRFASQREVDYWSSDLKAIEATALDFCRARVERHRLAMDVRHAEYQFDNKKLTFYFTASHRVDFVQMLKELYREFGCRIWMEKIS